ncbi:MAG: hypothetical protein KAR35_09125 [Candidatus Heimdallarchaeota archaeon]|nr:hypothetical protein [Candidatus Heimdallarchaeota archaeon]MCK5049518.1 hypothetical protein [Candidatus Heimdallarchaeota archaeon]
MYIAKIPGTRYECVLVNDHGLWKLQLTLTGHVEAETNVTNLSERTIHSLIGSLLASVQLNVNEFIHQQITKALVTQIGPLITDQEVTGGQTNDQSTVSKEIESLKERIAKLEARVKKLEV